MSKTPFLTFVDLSVCNMDTLYLQNMPLLINLRPSTPLYITEDVFPAENQREVHIIRFVCDVSCLYICIQTNMSECCLLECIFLNQKTNQNILYNVIDYTGIQLAMEMNISRFSHRDLKNWFRFRVKVGIYTMALLTTNTKRGGTWYKINKTIGD